MLDATRELEMSAQIVDFEPAHAQAFRTLNEAWISKYFRMEPADHLVLDNPVAQVIDKGGRIFMAVDHGVPVGCVALKAMADGLGMEEAARLCMDVMHLAGEDQP